MSVEAARPIRIATLALLSLFLLLSAAAGGRPGGGFGNTGPRAVHGRGLCGVLSRTGSRNVRYGSPLVDHLPAVSGIPTPKDVLGHHIGAPKTLTYYEDILRYYRALAEATSRVWVEINRRVRRGPGVWWWSGFLPTRTWPASDRNRENLARIADPRGLSEAEVQQILNTTKPNYHVIGGLHSGETGAPEMLMEMAYRLATETSPFITRHPGERLHSPSLPWPIPTGGTGSWIGSIRGWRDKRSWTRRQAEKDSVAGERRSRG